MVIYFLSFQRWRSTVLAYLLWHQRARGIPPQRYQKALRSFHRSLAEHRPRGYLGSVVLRYDGIPWAGPGECYEDSYFVSTFAALGTLDERAASGPPHEVPHQHIAQLSTHGAGGLYRLLAGAPGGSRTSRTLWLRKRDGRTYAEVRARLAELPHPPGASVWVRELGLGPAPDLAYRGRAGSVSLTGLEDLLEIVHDLYGTPVISTLPKEPSAVQ